MLVAIPGLAGSVPDLHIPYAAFDKAAGDQHLPPLHAVAIAVEHMLRLARHIKRLARLRLHPPGKLH